MNFSELYGRVNLGEGLLTTYGPEILQFLLVRAESFEDSFDTRLRRAFEQLKRRDVLPVFNELLQPDRRALDDVVFDVLGLTSAKREAVYEAVINLVKARLEKAKSV